MTQLDEAILYLSIQILSPAQFALSDLSCVGSMCSHRLSQSDHSIFLVFFFQCINSILFFQLKTLRTNCNSLKQENKCVGKILWALWGWWRLRSSLSMVKVIKNPGQKSRCSFKITKMPPDSYTFSQSPVFPDVTR